MTLVTLHRVHRVGRSEPSRVRDGVGFTGQRLQRAFHVLPAPYYRGQPLCIVEDLAVTVDGQQAERSVLRFGVRGKRWSRAEMETVTDERREFSEVATITVLRPGSLPPGAHEVTLAEQLRIAYLPWPSVTSTTKAPVI